jgi:hypothetical protein
VYTWNPILVWLLLGLLGIALGGGAMMVLFIRRWHRQQALFVDYSAETIPEVFPPRTFLMHRPASWLVIRGRNPQDVQAALGLNNPKPCTWTKGLASEQKLFIAPPVNGWILIVGAGLPDPADDVDACFRFLLDLSRKLGQVQFFSANRVLGYHAWVRVEAGRVVRAYAWAGKTVWNQGIKTRAELELGMKCFHYFEALERSLFGQSDVTFANCEKVPLLAARWSFDPAAIDERIFERACGIAGEPPRFY